MERQTAEIVSILGRKEEAARWNERARDRAARVNRELWDEAKGMYFDYNFERHTRRDYPFLTAFYPMWAGIASPEQARRIAGNLRLFERAGGLQTSTVESGDQWDAPFGWAPLEWIAVEGLRRYGHAPEADRVAAHFLKLVLDNYKRDGTLVEKYDVVHLRTDVGSELRFGYRSNEAGFGWTNAVFETLYDELPVAARKRIDP
jgi:alpha,alpha-trehalase